MLHDKSSSCFAIGHEHRVLDAGRSKHDTVFGEVLRNKSSGIALSPGALSAEERSDGRSRRRLRRSLKWRTSRVRAATSSSGGSVQLLDALGVADHQIKSGVGTTPHACVKLRPALQMHKKVANQRNQNRTHQQKTSTNNATTKHKSTKPRQSETKSPKQPHKTPNTITNRRTA